MQANKKILNVSGSFKKPKLKKNLGFGKIFTNRFFVQNFTQKRGWHNAKILNYKRIQLYPSSLYFHSAQNIFEGTKAYLSKSKKINFFRIRDNMIRFNKSAERMAIPKIDVDRHIFIIKQLVHLEKDWVPNVPGSSLYIRPVVIGIDKTLELRSSSDFLHFIILSPVSPYFGTNLKTISVLVSNKYVRSIRGLTGNIKTSVNYAGTLLQIEEAKKKNCEQVIWLDGKKRKYIEEASGMNIMFVYNNKIITPELSGSILEGITRDSIIKLSKKLGFNIKEKKIKISSVLSDIKKGEIIEIFTVGTGAIIGPIGKLVYKNSEYIVNNNKVGSLSKKLYETLIGIQTGEIEDEFNWIETL